jgi:positive regulator of sigma E activity
MKEEGKIIKIEGSEAVIEVSPQEACSKCCSCGAARARRVTVSADKTAGLSVGDIVEVEVDTSSMMKVYILMYGIPLVAFLFSIFSLYLVSSSPPVSFVGAILATGIIYLFIGRYMRSRPGFSPEICAKRD